MPTRRDIDHPLVLGAALFGVDWGLSGYCPGPALASLFSGATDAATFSVAMAAGLLIAKRMTR